jgi:hypothetical protein
VTHAEALRLAAHALRVRAWSLDCAYDETSRYVTRIREAAEILRELEPYYVPGSDAWKVAE